MRILRGGLGIRTSRGAIAVKTATVLMLAAGLLSVSSACAMASESAPSIESESVSGVNEHDANLDATINTNGHYTGYEFQVDTTGSFDFGGPACPFAIPGYMQCMVIVDGGEKMPGGVEPRPQYIAAATSPVTVSLDLASIGVVLQPGTTYHYRVIATSGGPVVEGPDQTFTTSPPGASPPSEVVVEPAEPSTKGFELKGRLNPQYSPTSYYFEYASVTCDEGCTPKKTAEGATLNGDLQQEVGATEVTGLTAGETYWYELVATNANGTVRSSNLLTFTAGESYRPSIDSESVSAVTGDDAKLEAQINPDGAETTYEFYLEAPSCANDKRIEACEASGGIPIAKGSIAAGSVDQTVSVDVADTGHILTPDTIEGYRVVATNKVGESLGNEKTFTTLASPAIDGESVSHLTENDATLEATINAGEGTPGVYYQFQLVNEPSDYRSEIACPLRAELKATDGCQGPEVQGATIGYIPSGSGIQTVSVDAASLGLKLEPGTNYHFRVLAATKIQTEDTTQWDTPPVYGSDQTFTTTSSHARPLGNESGSPPSGQSNSAGPFTSGYLPPMSGIPSGSSKAKSKPLTRAQKLARALKVCKHKPKSKRAACVKQAEKRYGQAKKGKHKSK